MIALAEDFFKVRNDPSQISVTEETMRRLDEIHPRTLNETRTEDGPVAWVLLLPTTRPLMQKFIQNDITERELLDLTPAGEEYQSIYLCSALVLPEYRGKGLAKNLCLDAIKTIRTQHPVESLFVWALSEEGAKLASAIARAAQLPLFERNTLETVKRSE
jgi:GNAT superfamily N-acetyltransferase